MIEYIFAALGIMAAGIAMLILLPWAMPFYVMYLDWADKKLRSWGYEPRND
jgi:hypothetical protein